MRDGFRIVDADRHVVEPFGLWRDHLDPEFRARAPRPVPFHTICEDPPPASLSAADARPMLVVAGKPVYRAMSRRAWTLIVDAALSRAFPGPLDRPETHLADMDAEGIDVAVLYPTYALLIEGVDTLDPPLAAALARAYNRWLGDFVACAPRRLVGAGLVSVHHPDAMAAEASRAARQGFRAVVIRPNPAGGRRLSDAAYARFWSTCEELGMPVVIHEGSHAHLPSAGAERFTSRFGQHACSHPMEQMIALLDLIEGGVLERHRRLRVALLEAGCGWVPYWLWRLDEEYAHVRSEVEERVRRAPSSYFREQAWVAAEPDEPYLPGVLHFVGADRILFGTDFPHVDHDEGLPARALARRASLSDDVLRRYLSDNAACLFGLESAGVSSST
ncbi:MAG TPA: amidohydrolase family protein [Polyangiaceae bacterium]|nr:amidohydrolase family protein [Polyangiaceae bacterium]